MIRISIASTSKKFIPYERYVLRVAKKTCALLRVNKISFEITLVTQKQIQHLNKLFLGKDRVTNVLSFQPPRTFIFPKSSHRFIGEVYISADFIKTHHQDLGRMVVHGILHLLGYDHIHLSDANRMERVEKRLLQKLATLRKP